MSGFWPFTRIYGSNSRSYIASSHFSKEECHSGLSYSTWASLCRVILAIIALNALEYPIRWGSQLLYGLYPPHPLVRSCPSVKLLFLWTGRLIMTLNANHSTPRERHACKPCAYGVKYLQRVKRSDLGDNSNEGSKAEGFETADTLLRKFKNRMKTFLLTDDILSRSISGREF